MPKLAKRLLIWIPVGLVALVILIGVLVFLNINRIIKVGVEKVLPQITSTPASLESAHISPLSGKGTLRGFALGNPEGYSMPHSLQFDNVSVDIDIRSLMTDTIVVNDILIDGPTITYEASGITSGNLQQILKNVQDFAGPPSPEKKPAEEKKPGKKVIIRHLLIKNAHVIASIQGIGQGINVPLPDIERRDIGKDSGGTSPAEAVASVLKSITDVVTNAVGGAVDAIKKAPKAVLDAGKGAVDAGKEGVGKAVEGVKGIFGGK